MPLTAIRANLHKTPFGTHTGTGTGKNTTNRNRVEPGNLDFVRMQRG